VFFLCDVEGLDVNDAAQILDLDPSLVKITSHRAQVMLQNLLAPELKASNVASKEMRFQEASTHRDELHN
jgi:DNA-directed RNA polymerase specialized sigma24 family protein